MIKTQCGYNPLMPYILRFRFLTVAITCVALMLIGISSSMVLVMPFSGMAYYSEICSSTDKVSGSTNVDLAKQGLAGGRQGKSHTLHCAYCLQYAGYQFFLPAQRVTIARLNLSDNFSRLLSEAGKGVTFWINAQARAPPFSEGRGLFLMKHQK
jgi:hypothetical protein